MIEQDDDKTLKAIHDAICASTKELVKHPPEAVRVHSRYLIDRLKGRASFFYNLYGNLAYYHTPDAALDDEAANAIECLTRRVAELEANMPSHTDLMVSPEVFRRKSKSPASPVSEKAPPSLAMREALENIIDMTENCAGVPTDPSSLPQMVLHVARSALTSPSSSPSSAMREVLEKAKKAICPWCAQGDPMSLDNDGVDRRGRYHSFYGGNRECKAAFLQAFAPTPQGEPIRDERGTIINHKALVDFESAVHRAEEEKG